MARCVVVGGNGFLGSYIVDLLAGAGHEVTVFDRFSAPGITYAASAVHAITGDFMDTEALRAALAGQEYLFHFLSTTTPATAENDPSLDLRTNVSQSVELFALAAASSIKRVYFASTGGAMYGETGDDRFSERSLPMPVSPYAIGKLSIEGYLRYFGRTRGLESVSYRLSNPYGPRQHPHKKQGVIPIFLHRIAEGLPVRVFGDGSMVRDYIYVEDAARMITATVGRSVEHSVYNIGSGVGTTITELIDLMREVTGRAVVVETRPQPATFVSRVVLDVARYSSEFAPAPTVRLREGMARTWQDTLEQLG